MPKTRNTAQLKNLAKYDVFINDVSTSSTYFQVTSLPSQFTGGRNSFLLAGSSLLKPQSTIQIEILDANGIPIYNNPVKNYSFGNSRLISIEINENTARGFATIIIMGEAVSFQGNPVPPNWQNKYNVRWTKRILIEPNIRNVSPLVLETTPTILVEEQRLHSVGTSSYTTSSITFTASLTPTLYSGHPIGYLIKAESPTKFIADYDNSYITGSLIIDRKSASLYLPITDILNDTTAFSTGQLIETENKVIVGDLYLRSGSYSTEIKALGKISQVTSSAKLVYNKLNINDVNVPVSYAKLRIIDLNTVSGEIYKIKVYNKVSSNISDYKLIADVFVQTTELLVTSSIRGDLNIGDFNISPTASNNWYSDKLEITTNPVYTISGSTAYYNSSSPVTPFTLNVGDDVLLRSIKAHVPIFSNQQYNGPISSSGYFIGNKRFITLFPTTEYTLQFDAVYKKQSGSINLIGVEPKVDIYIIGTSNNKIIDNNPLGQKIGTLTVVPGTEVQWYQDTSFNFNPALSTGGEVGVRFVISNGFWYFSEISLKPASDKLFAPDEIQFLVPNSEYYNEILQYKVEFFDINNNSTDVAVISQPVFFTGSVINLGVLP